MYRPTRKSSAVSAVVFATNTTKYWPIYQNITFLNQQILVPVWVFKNPLSVRLCPAYPGKLVLISAYDHSIFTTWSPTTCSCQRGLCIISSTWLIKEAKTTHALSSALEYYALILAILYLVLWVNQLNKEAKLIHWSNPLEMRLQGLCVTEC